MRPRLFCVFRRVKDRHNLLHDSQRLKKTCDRQVVLDKWFLLILGTCQGTATKNRCDCLDNQALQLSVKCFERRLIGRPRFRIPPLWNYGRLAEYDWTLEIAWLKKACQRPQFTGVREKWRGTVSSNSRFQTILFQQHTLLLSLLAIALRWSTCRAPAHSRII